MAHPAPVATDRQLTARPRYRVDPEGDDVVAVRGGSAWESNPPRRAERRVTGFEDRGRHRPTRTPSAIVRDQRLSRLDDAGLAARLTAYDRADDDARCPFADPPDRAHRLRRLRREARGGPPRRRARRARGPGVARRADRRPRPGRRR